MSTVVNKKVLVGSLVLLLLISINVNSQTASLESTLSIQEVDGTQVPFQNGIPLVSFERQQRTIISLEGSWKKERFQANHDISLAKRDEAGYSALLSETGSKHQFTHDDSNWELKQIPFVENQMNTYPTVPEYYENGVFYRYKFSLEDSLSSKAAKLNFLSVNYVADVWLNEEYLGYHEGGFTPFAFDVSDKLNYNSENLLVVRVDNIPWGSRKDIVPFYRCDWFNYAGIIHDVYLEFSNKVHVVRADNVTKNLEGEFESRIVINNSSDEFKTIDLNIEVFEAAIDETNIETENWNEIIGNKISLSGNNQLQLSVNPNEVKSWKTNLKINDPNLWTITEPNLYIIKITLKENGVVKDIYHTQFGIRTITTDSNKVKLNNDVIFLTGAARHEDHPLYGRSIPKSVIFSDLNFIKNSKINFLRTSHYPNHPYTYLIADRIGLTIMEEIPVWWFDNETEWLIQNNERKIHQQMFREMVFKDFNRASIILWSTSNECKEETNRLIYNEMIVDDIRSNYPDNRLISQSSAGDKPGSNDLTQVPLDVAGWTLYFGIFHGSTYYAGTASFLSRVKNAFPDKPIIDTEFGYWSSENGSSEAKQVTVFNETFKAFKFFSTMKSDGGLNSNGNLMASTWWCVFDWYSHQHPNGFQSMGLVSMDRQYKKPVYDALISGYSPYYDFGGTVTSVIETDIETIPTKYELFQNYPNPFNPSTKITYSIPTESYVNIELFDVIGQKINLLVSEQMNAGVHSYDFIADNLPSGIYICRINAQSLLSNDKYSASIKMLLLK